MNIDFSLYPSLISSDLLQLKKTVEILDPYVQGYHIDIMDGHFVPNITWGPAFVRALSSVTNLPLHIHCMVADPMKVVDWFSLRPQDLLIVHVETVIDLHGMIEKIRDKEVRVGIALNPETPVQKIENFIGMIDHLLIMSVQPGFSGQIFISSTFKKYIEAKKIIDEQESSCELGADGGVTLANIRSIVAHGVKHLATAQALFSFDDLVIGVESLVQAVENKNN